MTGPVRTLDRSHDVEPPFLLFVVANFFVFSFVTCDSMPSFVTPVPSAKVEISSFSCHAIWNFDVFLKFYFLVHGILVKTGVSGAVLCDILSDVVALFPTATTESHPVVALKSAIFISEASSVAFSCKMTLETWMSFFYHRRFPDLEYPSYSARMLSRFLEMLLICSKNWHVVIYDR